MWAQGLPARPQRECARETLFGGDVAGVLARCMKRADGNLYDLHPCPPCPFTANARCTMPRPTRAQARSPPPPPTTPTARREAARVPHVPWGCDAMHSVSTGSRTLMRRQACLPLWPLPPSPFSAPTATSPPAPTHHVVDLLAGQQQDEGVDDRQLLVHSILGDHLWRLVAAGVELLGTHGGWWRGMQVVMQCCNTWVASSAVPVLLLGCC